MLGPRPSSVGRALDLVRRGAGPERKPGGAGERRTTRTILHVSVEIRTRIRRGSRRAKPGRLPGTRSRSAPTTTRSVWRSARWSATTTTCSVPARGFDDAPAHSDLEIVTWVVSGALLHTDSTGTTTVVPAGRWQVLSAGDGRGALRDRGRRRAARFVQVWLTPDEAGDAPRTHVRPVALPGGGLGAGRPGRDPARGLHRSAARLWRPAAPGDTPLPATAAARLRRHRRAAAVVAGRAAVGRRRVRDDRRAGRTRSRRRVPTELLVWTFAAVTWLDVSR